MRLHRAAHAFIVMMLTVVLCAVLAGCPAPLPPPVPPTGTPTCETACARLEQLGCNAAKATPAGTPCITVCVNVETSGVVIYGVECVTAAESCAAADRCGGPAR